MFGIGKGTDGKERKKRTTRKYGQASLKHSRMGKYSCGFAAASFALLSAALLTAFVMRSETAGFVGGFGILAIILAGLGIRAAVKGFRERERRYITCRIGLGLNIVILAGLLLIFFGGLF